ncbi:MAG TPA: autotransporter outer membrane beta-barrel domain-containing protein [Bradyrhizobium sp.]|nr:autotransporter outer membrane beta-barrel domain-containing protein [Bradyrhizobium sp.]
MGNRGRLLWNGARAILSAGAFLAWQAELAQAHTVSIGYVSDGPGAITFWYGTYHTGVTYTEGSLQLVGGSGYSATVAFTLLTLVKPTGLVDGTNNFYSNGTTLVGDFASSAYAYAGPVAAWQGAAFTGLRAGTYTFTYIPIATPTQVWQPEDSVILSYTVDLSGALLGGTQLSPFAVNANQRSVAGALDGAIAGGATSTGISALGSMGADQISNALSQISGESAAGARQAAMQTLGPFLGMMIDPFVTGRDTPFGTAALGFAPEHDGVPPDIARAYAAFTKAPPLAAASAPQWNVWGTPFGGQSQINGNADVGSHDTTVRTAGIAAGFDYRVAPATVVGFALAGGNTSWGLASNLGGGRGDVFQAGAYASTRFGSGYLSASLAAGLYSMSTNHTVDVTGTSQLNASFDAVNYGGRIEGGYRFDTPVVGVTPYAAVQVQAFHAPSYSETSATGATDFALTYNSQNSTDTRTELGSWVDRAFLLQGDTTLVLRARAAWAHDWVNGTAINAVFQSLPTTGFTVNGAVAAPDSALVTAGAELKFRSGWALGAKFDGEFASNVRSYAGTGSISYRW